MELTIEIKINPILFKEKSIKLKSLKIDMVFCESCSDLINIQ